MVNQLEEYYEKFIINKVPLVLTQVDRDKDSKTFGSCDRNYWHLKIRDFSSAILQQTGLTLALLYKENFDNNIYYNNEIVKEWAIGILKYLGKIQLKDGSFNEYYPNEHGYPPTAFTLFAASMAYMELELCDDEILNTLKKSAYWLVNRRETKAYNQEWAAIAGIFLYEKISGDEDIKPMLDQKLRDILKMQSDEGWFPEQGGADIGYSSVALDMMAEYYWYSRDERVKEPLNKLVRFLQYFVHPDGTIGGEYGSRNTIYFMPNGVETVSSLNLESSDIALAILKHIYRIEDIEHDFMNAVDERYLTHKGGIIKLYTNDKEITWECGYRSVIQKGKIATTNWLDDSYKITWSKGKEDVVLYEVKGQFNVVKQKVQNPFYHLGLRIAAVLLGGRVNKVIKKFTIFSGNHSDLGFTRRIVLKEDKVIIEDQLTSKDSVSIEEANNISLRLVASGNFFNASDLLRTNFEKYELNKELRICKEIDFESGTIKRERR